MATIKKRLNISLASDLGDALTKLARRDSIPLAKKVAELLNIGLEAEEDAFMEKITTERHKTKRGSLSHDEVWR